MQLVNWVIDIERDKGGMVDWQIKKTPSDFEQIQFASGFKKNLGGLNGTLNWLGVFTFRPRVEP